MRLIPLLADALTGDHIKHICGLSDPLLFQKLKKIKISFTGQQKLRIKAESKRSAFASNGESR
jgi:hypothetical protein